MRLKKIALSCFRNYDQEVTEFGPGVNVIAGPNAQGKTNLLEAIYLLTGNHSFRTRFDRELISFGCDRSELLADVQTGEITQNLHMLLRRGRSRQIMLNGAKKTASELSGTVTAVLFVPDDLNLIKEGAAARRRLLDGSISQLRSNYHTVMSGFARLYENKTRILKDRFDNPSLLDALDEFSDSLARYSARIIRYRASYIEKLALYAAPIHREFSDGREELRLTYHTVSTVTDPLADVEKIYHEILEHQQRHRRAELDSCQCLTGAHKDDMEISINGISARSFASQGQMRTAALSLKLAEREIFRSETGEYPILLLDDVLSELDETRQSFVLNRIGGGQTLITCCEDESISDRTGGCVFSVHGGKIRRER